MIYIKKVRNCIDLFFLFTVNKKKKYFFPLIMHLEKENQMTIKSHKYYINKNSYYVFCLILFHIINVHYLI